MDLEQDFNITILPLKPDYEGDVIATLIASKHNKASNKANILYVHGYIDYFFHPHVAEQCHNNHYNFYALDLRKSGRSILNHQRPYFIKSMTEYYEEVNAAIAIILKENALPIYLLGHSTGGLLVLSYMNSSVKNNAIKGIILNAPFVDMPQPTWVTNSIFPVLKGIVKLFPQAKVNGVVSSVYVQSVHKAYKGEWDFNTKLKPIKGFPTYFKWLVAIREAQLQLKNSTITEPILLLHSSKSIKPFKYHESVMKADTVLDVEDMKRLSKNLGDSVLSVELEDAMHDVFLSNKAVREKAFRAFFEWLNDNHHSINLK